MSINNNKSGGKFTEFLPLPYIGMFDLDVIYQASDTELLYKILSLVNDIAESQNTVLDEFNKILEWANSQIETYTKETLEKWLEDGTLKDIIGELFDELSEKVTTNTNDIAQLKKDLATETSNRESADNSLSSNIKELWREEYTKLVPDELDNEYGVAYLSNYNSSGDNYVCQSIAVTPNYMYVGMRTDDSSNSKQRIVVFKKTTTGWQYQSYHDYTALGHLNDMTVTYDNGYTQIYCANLNENNRIDVIKVSTMAIEKTIYVNIGSGIAGIEWISSKYYAISSGNNIYRVKWSDNSIVQTITTVESPTLTHQGLAFDRNVLYNIWSATSVDGVTDGQNYCYGYYVDYNNDYTIDNYACKCMTTSYSGELEGIAFYMRGTSTDVYGYMWCVYNNAFEGMKSYNCGMVSECCYDTAYLDEDRLPCFMRPFGMNIKNAREYSITATMKCEHHLYHSLGLGSEDSPLQGGVALASALYTIGQTNPSTCSVSLIDAQFNSPTDNILYLRSITSPITIKATGTSNYHFASVICRMCSYVNLINICVYPNGGTNGFHTSNSVVKDNGVLKLANGYYTVKGGKFNNTSNIINTNLWTINECTLACYGNPSVYNGNVSVYGVVIRVGPTERPTFTSCTLAMDYNAGGSLVEETTDSTTSG